MAYTQTAWKDSPDTSSPINAASLNKMETGIADAHIANATIAAALTKKIDLPATANEGDVLTYKGGKWVAVAPTTVA